MTALRRLFLAGALLAGMACGQDKGDVSCNPPPQITSYPPTSAIVGQQYVYSFDASYLCGLWTICKNIEGIQLPPGAMIDDFYDSITWTPGADQANREVAFKIATKIDDCGDRAVQSWTVYVSAGQ